MQYDRPLPPVPSHRERLVAGGGASSTLTGAPASGWLVRARKKRQHPPTDAAGSCSHDNSVAGGGYTIRHDGTVQVSFLYPLPGFAHVFTSYFLCWPAFNLHLFSYIFFNNFIVAMFHWTPSGFIYKPAGKYFLMILIHWYYCWLLPSQMPTPPAQRKPSAPAKGRPADPFQLVPCIAFGTDRSVIQYLIFTEWGLVTWAAR